MFNTVRLPQGLQEFEVVYVNDDSVCPVGYLCSMKVSLAPKNRPGDDKAAPCLVPQVIHVPPDWSPPVLTPEYFPHRCENFKLGGAAHASACLAEASEAIVTAEDASLPQSRPGSLDATPLLFSMHAHAQCNRSEQGTADGVAACLQELSECLHAEGLPWNAVLLVHLALSDLTHFAVANAAYCRVVPQVAPPARVCVQLPSMQCGSACAVDALVAREAAMESRRCLHVQSISEWAPACIGPYAQATVTGGLLSMAGQIPLDPATMTVCLLC
jgi:enamine deaminase RidA (YjgF/YER057c/UK114 family)